MLKRIKEIKSKSGELHFERWSIIDTSFFKVYLHHIAERDMDLHPHSHPWHFISIILRGGYIEEWVKADGTKKKSIVHNFPSLFFRKAQDFHKITWVTNPKAEYYRSPVYTLVFAFGKRRPWGFKVGNMVVGNEEYRQLKHEGLL
jgi:hypothetical protein